MIAVSPNAVSELRALLDKRGAPPGTGLRLLVQKGGCAGFQYAMKIDQTNPADAIFTEGGVSVLVDPESLPYLDGSVVDYHDGLTDSGFKITNPNAARACGCGSSFEPARGPGRAAAAARPGRGLHALRRGIRLSPAMPSPGRFLHQDPPPLRLGRALEGPPKTKPRYTLMWALTLSFMSVIAVGSWVFSLYVFGHPEEPLPNEILRRLGRLDPPKRFDIYEVPTGKGLPANEAYAKYRRFLSLEPAEVDALNARLSRDYLQQLPPGGSD